MEDRICCCFGHSEEDRASDVLESRGRSRIMERIVAGKKSGGCSCGGNHPPGR